MLLDRRSEREVLDRLVADLRWGGSRALVLRGDAGIGKTPLLEYVAGQAAGWQVVRAAGIEAETELAFAALHQVCAPMLEQLPRLPGPQREALSTAFGLSVSSPPDRFMLGLAVLGLFAEVARERPLLCLIDDAQWLDRASAQVLGFAARRLGAESVAMILAVCAGAAEAEVPELAGLAEVEVTGLPDEDARALLALAFPGPVDDSVLDRIIAESQGNPLALLELPRGFTPAELAGGFGLLSSAALPRRIEESFRRQIATLSPTTRQVLLVAAAEPVGDPVLVWRAVDQLGIGVDTDLVTREAEAGLVEFGSRVTFRHPLLRSAIYLAATAEDRRNAHRALAQVTDPDADPDRRAWHRAQAAVGHDEEVAAELDHCAGRAQARGGPAAAAAFFERAADLSPDPARRGQRLLAAAQAAHQSGMPEISLQTLARAEASPLTALERAEVDLLRARIAFTADRGRDTPSLLLKAAVRMQPLDRHVARDTYLDAIRAAWYAADPSSAASLRVVAEAARASPAPAAPVRAPDLLLAGLAARYTDGYAAGVPMLKEALRAFRSPDLSEEGLRWLWYASAMCLDLCDDEAADALANRFVDLARDSGALATLPVAFINVIVVQILAGDLAAAGSMLEQLRAVSEGTGIRPPAYAAQLLAAWQGQEAKTAELIAATSADAKRRGEGVGPITAGWTKALLCNSLGQYDEALVAAQQAAEQRQELRFLTWGLLVELVTAAVRAGRKELAYDALERLTELTQATATDWALGLQARCQALINDTEAAETYYREAIDRLARTRIRGELARSYLHYGEWLRRRNRRNDAREQLRTAHAMFTAMGMDSFAARTAWELGTTGETVRKRRDATSSQLTAQEAQIAGLAQDGLTNPEIAAQLFISHRTVEWHLRKAYSKLGITSRRQLRD